MEHDEGSIHNIGGRNILVEEKYFENPCKFPTEDNEIILSCREHRVRVTATTSADVVRGENDEDEDQDSGGGGGWSKGV